MAILNSAGSIRDDVQRYSADISDEERRVRTLHKSRLEMQKLAA